MVDSFNNIKEKDREEALSKIAEPLGVKKTEINTILSDLDKAKTKSEQSFIQNFIDKITDLFSKLFYGEKSAEIKLKDNLTISSKEIKKSYVQKIQEERESSKNTSKTL
jgi:hypothetical protein